MHAVPGSVGRNLGLIDRHCRQVEALRSQDTAPAEHEGAGQVDDIGVEVLQQSFDAADSTGSDANPPILRQGDRGDPHDAGSGDLLGTVAARAWCDDEDFVAAVGQVVEDAEE